MSFEKRLVMFEAHIIYSIYYIAMGDKLQERKERKKKRGSVLM